MLQRPLLVKHNEEMESYRKSERHPGQEHRLEEESLSQQDAERLLKVVRETRDKPARQVVEAIFLAVQEFRGDTPPNDDMTAVALRITA